MIRLENCLKTQTLEAAALYLTNKVAFNYRRGFTVGCDNQTYWDFAAHYESNIDKIKSQIMGRRYEFGPCLKISRRVKLNKVRDIYIAPWRDRIVDRWLNDCLNRLLDDWFSGHSYAYRIDELGIDKCQNEITQAVKTHKFMIKRDITRYFYTIDHETILGMLSKLVDPSDYLFEMLRQRIQFRYVEKGKDVEQVATIGVPFGTSIACTLANIYLTNVDKVMSTLPVKYFRYADDFLILAKSGEAALYAASVLDNMVSDLKLSMKPSHSINMSFVEHDGFVKVTKFKHLGLEFYGNGTVRLAVEKQRKVMNLFKRSLGYVETRIKKTKGLDNRLAIAIGAVNQAMADRIRSVAIIDYYVKHIDDEVQMRMMDRMTAEMIISCVLGKPFRNRDFRTVPFQKLRGMGLMSILHRHRLYKHGHLKSDFLSLHNELITNRYMSTLNRRRERINHIKMARKLRTETKQAAR